MNVNRRGWPAGRFSIGRRSGATENAVYPLRKCAKTARNLHAQRELKSNADLDVRGDERPVSFLLPTPRTTLDYGATGPFPTADDGGIGDLLIGPALQFAPITGAGGNPLFVHRLEAQFIIPTGDYSPAHDINAGSNFFSFNPYWAGTVFIGPRLASSFRAHYLWNATNKNPTASTGATTTKAGDAFHVNFTLDYEVIPQRLRVGLNGYLLEQISDSEMNGVDTGEREQVVAIGQGLLYSFSRERSLFVNLYFEAEAENRPEGTALVVRYVHKCR